MSDVVNGIHKNTTAESGSLYVVSTPIGNLGDITFRAVETLKTVDLIAAEDTRRASILTKKYRISTPRLSYHEHNARRRIPDLMKRLLSGQNIALIADAGTPGISDPGFKLIRCCIDHAVPVTAVPGAAAFLAAIVVSGLPAHRFVFEGFLPVKKGRRKRLELLSSENRTIILYESPHRIERTLKDLLEYCGDRKVALVREITKLYEEIIHADLSRVIGMYEMRKPKGEYVLVIHGADR